MPRKNENQAAVVMPEADAIVRATDFFKPAWEVPTEVGARGAAGIESLSRSIRKNRRTDGEG
jgi:hypothetical protein